MVTNAGKVCRRQQVINYNKVEKMASEMLAKEQYFRLGRNFTYEKLLALPKLWHMSNSRGWETAVTTHAEA